MSESPIHLYAMIQRTLNKETKSTLSPSLTDISIKNLGDCGSETVLFPFFKVPSLRRFTARDIFESGPESPRLDCEDYPGLDVIEELNSIPVRSSAAAHIRLRKSFTGIGFGCLIGACARLESFIYYNYNLWQEGSFVPSEFYPHLYGHKDTLGELTMVYDSDNDTIVDNNELMGSLSDFSVLKRLQLRAANLLGPDHVSLVDRLPPSLESLRITGVDDTDNDTMALARRLRDVITVSKKRFPRLNTLTIENGYNDIGSSDDEDNRNDGFRALEDLEDDCKEAGIDFEITT